MFTPWNKEAKWRGPSSTYLIVSSKFTKKCLPRKPAELKEACICAAATAVISYVLGYGYVDVVVHDDGEGWPTTMSDVDTARWPMGDRINEREEPGAPDRRLFQSHE